MDGTDFIDNQKRLENLKDLFSKFIDVAKNVNTLHDAHTLSSELNVKDGKTNSGMRSQLDVSSSGAHDVYVTHNSPNESTIISGTQQVYCIDVEPNVDVATGNYSVYTNVTHQMAICSLGAKKYCNKNDGLEQEIEIECGNYGVYANVLHDHARNSPNESSFNFRAQNMCNNGNAKLGVDVESGLNHNACSDFYPMLGPCTKNGGTSETGTNIVSSEHEAYVALPTVMMDLDLNSCSSNETTIPETMKEMVHQSQAESSDNIVVVTVGGRDHDNADVDELSNEKPEPFNLNDLNVERRHGCDNTKMIVQTSDEGSAKKYCCVYCLKPFSKLVTHLTTKHKNEADVIKLQALEVGSKERRAVIDKIRKQGQFEWNMDGDINQGVLFTSRRPKRKFKREAILYKTCGNCKGQYYNTTLRAHWNKCTNNSFAGERIVKNISRVVECRVHAEACEELTDIVFASLRDNKEALTIRFDWIVIIFGNDLCVNYAEHFQLDMVCAYLRNAGKLLVAARKINPAISDFASIYQVKNCNSVIEAIRTIAQFDSKIKTLKSPATASALVTLVNKIGQTLLIEYMKLDEEDKEKSVNRFLTVFQKDARLKINKMVVVAQAKMKREKGETDPSTEDIEKLTDFINAEREACYNELTQRYTFETWLQLSQLTLLSVMIFNRKRVGDTQNILVSDFIGRKIITEHTDKSIFDSIPEETKRMIKSRMLVRGKLYRTVSVLLKHNFDDCLEVLLRHRTDAGVPDNNKFLFGLPSKSEKIKTVDAGALLRKYSKLCGAENPSTLRGTGLRKHFATMCGDMSLSDNDVSNVAKFMGHSEKIHRDVYRKNTLSREVVQMSTLLKTAEGKNNTAFDTVGRSGSGNVDGNPKGIPSPKPKKKPIKTATNKTIRNRQSKAKTIRKVNGHPKVSPSSKPKKKMIDTAATKTIRSRQSEAKTVREAKVI